MEDESNNSKFSYAYKKCSGCNGTGKEIDDVKSGARLKADREVAGVSLRALARKLEWSATYVSDLEQGKRKITEAKVTRYLDALKTV